MPVALTNKFQNILFNTLTPTKTLNSHRPLTEQNSIIHAREFITSMAGMLIRVL